MSNEQTYAELKDNRVIWLIVYEAARADDDAETANRAKAELLRLGLVISETEGADAK
jgi:hypothetical protein